MQAPPLPKPSPDETIPWKIGVVIPAFNESESIAGIVATCAAVARPGETVRVVVCDNGSTDGTGDVARASGAEVAVEPARGYGAACLAGLAHLGEWPDIILFCDADSGAPVADLHAVLAALRARSADLVIGARRRAEKGSMSAPQIFGNWLATRLIRILWGRRFFDLGPTRAITRPALEELSMRDRTWGWTVEMQIQAVRHGLRIDEVDVEWRKRKFGTSKVSGTIVGCVKAGVKILWTLFVFALKGSVRKTKTTEDAVRSSGPVQPRSGDRS